MYNYIQLRNRELVEAIIREMACHDAPQVGIRVIMRRAIEHGAPRYYFTYETAMRMMSAAGKRAADVDNLQRRRQWHDFHRAVEERRRQGMSLTMAVTHTLALDPAPSFYLSVSQAQHIWNEYKRNRTAHSRA